jgi:uncharacterized protein
MVGKHPKRIPRPGVDRAGRTSLHYAASEGSVAEVTRLLRSRADANAQDDNGWSPLHFAAQANSVEVVRALITAGANVDAIPMATRRSSEPSSRTRAMAR